MINKLTQIWQRVLQRPFIGVEESFFSLGGSFEAADQLFLEIANEFGRELPSSTIYHAQTIGALASLLRQPTVPMFSPLVQVKAGWEQPPILIVHGMAGTVPFFDLARHIRTGHSVCGFQAKGLDGLEKPLDRVEDMAQFYLDSLEDLQPHGPFFLVGYSFGGLVALEMAQRLTARGEEIALLVLVDTYPHINRLAMTQRLKLIAQRGKRILSEIDQRLLRAARRIKSGFRSVGNHYLGNRPDKRARLSFDQTTQRVRESAYRALARYRPEFYSGKIEFVKSGSDSYYPADPVAVWGTLTAAFEFEIVPGGHLDMLTSDCEALAAVITRYASEALEQEYELARTGYGVGLVGPI